MKGMDGAGFEGDRRPYGPEMGVLAGLDVPALRRFLVMTLRAGGVPVWRIGEVMRCSTKTVKRMEKTPGPTTNPDRSAPPGSGPSA